MDSFVCWRCFSLTYTFLRKIRQHAKEMNDIKCSRLPGFLKKFSKHGLHLFQSEDIPKLTDNGLEKKRIKPPSFTDDIWTYLSVWIQVHHKKSNFLFFFGIIHEMKIKTLNFFCEHFIIDKPNYLIRRIFSVLFPRKPMLKPSRELLISIFPLKFWQPHVLRTLFQKCFSVFFVGGKRGGGWMNEIIHV